LVFVAGGARNGSRWCNAVAYAVRSARTPLADPVGAGGCDGWAAGGAASAAGKAASPSGAAGNSTPPLPLSALMSEASGLPDSTWRQVAVWKLQQYTNVEIAGRLDCSVRRVERILARIREFWEASEGQRL